MTLYKRPEDEETRHLKAAYIQRLIKCAEQIKSFLVQAKQQLPQRRDLKQVLSLAHRLGGSGMTFGFPEISRHGHEIDLYLDKMLRTYSDIRDMPHQDFFILENRMLDLLESCAQAIQKENAPKNGYRFA